MTDKYGLQMSTTVFVNELSQQTDDLLLAKVSEFLDKKGYNRIIEVNGANLVEIIERGLKLVYCCECVHFKPFRNYEIGYCRKNRENMTDFAFCHGGERKGSEFE